MRLRVILFALFSALALVPGLTFAQANDSGDAKGGFALRIDGDYNVRQGETLETLVVISGNAVVDGTLETLVVIDGDATINGSVTTSVTVISGALRLAPGSTLKDATLISSDLERDPAATVTGDIDRRSRLFFRGAGLVFGAIFWVDTTVAVLLAALVFWAGTTVAVLLAGLLFAALGGRQLIAAGETMTRSPGQSILASVVAGAALPIVAIVAIATVVGLPLGFGILFFAGPALLFAGYLVAGGWLGGLILGAARSTEPRPYAAVLLGLAILQVALLIPGVGWISAFALAAWGAGALVYLGWRKLRPSGGAPEAPAAPVPPGPVPAM